MTSSHSSSLTREEDGLGWTVIRMKELVHVMAGEKEQKAWVVVLVVGGIFCLKTPVSRRYSWRCVAHSVLVTQTCLETQISADVRPRSERHRGLNDQTWGRKEQGGEDVMVLMVFCI